MRNFTSIIASVLFVASSLVGRPANAADVTLDAGPGIKWVTTTDADGNPEIPIKAGDVLIIRQADVTIPHGFRFNGTGASPTIPLCDQGAPTAGTAFCQVSPYDRRFPGLGAGANARGEIIRIRALQDLSTDMPFECVVHGPGMKGTLKK